MVPTLKNSTNTAAILESFSQNGIVLFLDRGINLFSITSQASLGGETSKSFKFSWNNLSIFFKSFTSIY